MRLNRRFVLCIALLAQAALASSVSAATTSSPSAEYLKWAAGACKQLISVYNRCGANLKIDKGVVHFNTTMGKRDVPCTDGQQLAFYDRLDKMDLASMYMIPYQTGVIPLPETRQNNDPGRLRSEDLMAAVYGGSKEEVRANLAPVSFLGQQIKFQKNMGAAAALERVGAQLLEAGTKDPKIAKFLEPFTTGKIALIDYSFAWRFVKGTTRLSTHSFGTGIDLDTDKGPMYWLWDLASEFPDKAKEGEVAFKDYAYVPKGKLIMPQIVVDIFEANGFIWGGKWNHYDTMHFEYRPEFLPNAPITCPTAQ